MNEKGFPRINSIMQLIFWL